MTQLCIIVQSTGHKKKTINYRAFNSIIREKVSNWDKHFSDTGALHSKLLDFLLLLQKLISISWPTFCHLKCNSHRKIIKNPHKATRKCTLYSTVHSSIKRASLFLMVVPLYGCINWKRNGDQSYYLLTFANFFYIELKCLFNH